MLFSYTEHLFSVSSIFLLFMLDFYHFYKTYSPVAFWKTINKCKHFEALVLLHGFHIVDIFIKMDIDILGKTTF